MQNLFRVLIVVIHHVLAVPLGGGRAGAFVEDSFDLAELFTCHNLDKEVFFIHVVGDVQIDQVHELGAVFQVVYDQNVGDAFVIEGFDNIAADKARAAGNDDHNGNLCSVEFGAIPNTNTHIISLVWRPFSHSPICSRGTRDLCCKNDN
ncbi:hypothetical protein D3C76_952090 [compost metagenome]